MQDEHTEDDIIIEDETGLPEATQKNNKTKDALKACMADKQEYLDGWQRTKADLANYKKNEAERASEMARFATEKLIVDLLPVIDSFSMAFADKEAWEKIDPSWRVGVEHIHSQLIRTLEDYGTTTIDPLGQVFDPTQHESVGVEEVEDEAVVGTVIRVVQNGYLLNDKIIRSARVIVGEKGAVE